MFNKGVYKLVHSHGASQNTQLKASNAKNESHEFPDFLLEKFRNFGT